MDDAADAMKVEWREWGRPAFEHARETETPILLSITAQWCGWCQSMDAATYAEPRIAANVNHHVVPIRVDADRHPRVRDRYNVGGFPSTVFLTPDGHLIAAASYLTPDQLRRLVDGVGETWAEDGAAAGRLTHPLQDEPPAGPVTRDIERYINGQVDVQFDDEHAGWGTEEQFPLPATLEFTLKRQHDRAVRTADAIAEHLFDPVDGGFFRHANERDWSDPTREKVLDVNAGLLQAFAHAYLVTGTDDYRETATRTMDWLVETLWTGAGFGNAQWPGEYFERPAEERADAEAPPIDESVYAGPNARAAGALAWLVAYTDDETARRYATDALSHLETNLVEDGVVSHSADHEEPGILTAQAGALQGVTAAAQVLDAEYRDLATAIADSTIDRLATDTGAFRDGPLDGAGLLDQPLYPIDENARLADALVDLHHLTGVERYLDVATDIVGAFAGAADRMGPQVAAYGTAASRVVRHPLVIGVGTETGTDLHRAALRMADHEKVVVPAAEGVESGHAALLTADGVSGDATSPDELALLVTEYEPTTRVADGDR